jgi:hypothetical protein
MYTPEAAVTASRRLARPRSWQIFSLCHLHGIQMLLCRAFDLGQRKQAEDIMSVMTLRFVSVIVANNSVGHGLVS